MRTFLQGILIGLANIIPGVSGGTLALVLGIYGRLIKALGAVDTRFALAGIKLLTGRRSAREEFVAEWKRTDMTFLCVLGLGAVAAILATARLMDYLLRQHHAAAYAFFVGVVLVSIVFPARCLTRRSWREVACFLLAAGLTIALPHMVSETRQIEKAERKAALEAAQAPAEAPVRGLISLDAPSPLRLLAVFFSAALAISAMILPGISGSFVLLLLGVYFDLLLAINERQVIFLAVFCLGLLVGLMGFARIMAWLLDRAYNGTMAFMIGLMTGSLYILWPFKKTVTVAGEVLYLGNIVPSTWGGAEWVALCAFAVGCALVGGFALLPRKKLADG
jgi:putative membrane protein